MKHCIILSIVSIDKFHMPINIFGGSHENKLIDAIENADYQKVEKLISKKIDVNFRSDKRGTPLIKSLFCPNKKIFLLLYQNGADINFTTQNGYSPLIISCIQNNYSVTNFLIEKGANIHQKTLEGWTALLYSSGNFPFSYDSITSDMNRELIQSLHKQTNYHTEHDPFKSVDLLIKKGANPNDTNIFGITPLMRASEVENFKIIELLIQSGSKINQCDKDGLNALMHAVGSSVQTYYNSLTDLRLMNLELTFYLGFPEAVKRDLQEIFFQNQNQTTSLLVENGCDLDVVDHNGWTALMHAARSGNLTLIKNLVNEGMKFDKTTPEGVTLLHLAAMFGENRIIEYLLKNGFDVNGKMKDGETPLMTAIWNGHVNTVDYLIKKGANVNALKRTPYNPQGETAVQWVVHRYETEKDEKYLQIFELLSNAGAKI